MDLRFARRIEESRRRVYRFSHEHMLDMPININGKSEPASFMEGKSPSYVESPYTKHTIEGE